MVIKITQNASETYDIILTILAYISMQSNVWKYIIDVYKKKGRSYMWGWRKYSY